MPGSVSCIIWFLSFFGVWGLLFSSLFPPSFGALSLYPSTYNLVRFLGEWSQNLIAFFEWRTLVFVIFVFEKIIVDFCCCLSRRCLSPLHHLCVSLFLYVDWLCIYLSLSFSPASLSWTPYLSHLSLNVFDMGVLRLFWLVSMLHPTLADWLNYIFWFFSLTLGHVMRPYLAAYNFCLIKFLILSQQMFFAPLFLSPSPLCIDVDFFLG